MVKVTDVPESSGGTAIGGSVEIIGLGEFMVGRCIGKKDGRKG